MMARAEKAHLNCPAQERTLWQHSAYLHQRAHVRKVRLHGLAHVRELDLHCDALLGTRRARICGEDRAVDLPDGGGSEGSGVERAEGGAP